MKSIPKFGRQRVIRIVMEASVTPGAVQIVRYRLRLPAPAAQRDHMFIGDLELSQRFREPVTVKLRVRTRTRQPSHISYDPAAGCAKDVQEVSDAAVRMSDREEWVSHFGNITVFNATPGMTQKRTICSGNEGAPTIGSAKLQPG